MEGKLTIKPKQRKEKMQFVNSIYYKPFYNKELKSLTGDDVNDCLAIIYRNEETDEKHLKILNNPTIQYFVANDDVEIKEDHPKQIKLEDVHIEKVKFKHLLKRLCQLQDEEYGTNTNFDKKYYRDGNPRKGLVYEANKFHLFNRVFSSDIDIEDYWKGRFIDMYPNATNSKISKAYTDIEVDSIDINGFPEPEDALCPINALTMFVEENNTFYTLLLENSVRENPQIEELKNNLKPFKKKLKKEFGSEYNFVIKFFEDEMDLICFYFGLNNKFKPDYNMIWNMGFDIPYILNRIGVLCGYTREMRETTHRYEFQADCANICSDPDFPEYLRVAKYQPDVRNQKASEKIDTFRVSSYVQWYDQLCLYAALRKGMGELESLSLSYVSQKELGDDKLNYMESGSNIKTLPYDNYEMFVMYNIKDVLLQVKIENKNNDLGLLYSIAEITKTRVCKAMRKTVSLKNMAHHFYIEQGFVQGNNFNLTFGDESGEPDEKFEGAYVADPNLNGYNGATINGSLSKFIYDYVIDFDYSALYPSIIRAFNIDANTQYGRILFAGEKPTKEFDMGGEFIDNLETGDMISLTNKYLGTPTISDILEECEKEGLLD